MSTIDSNDWRLLETVWDYLLLESELPEHVDAIVIGGSGLQVDGAQRAAELYFRGHAPVIVVSGFANPEFSASENEAALLASELRARGVPSGAILTDNKAANTGDNILYSAALLREQGILPRSVTLIHKPYMRRRFLATAQAQWPAPQPEFYVTSAPTTIQEYYDVYDSLYGRERNPMIPLMLGDYERIKSYPAKGFSVEQPFSQVADDAYHELLRRGYGVRETD